MAGELNLFLNSFMFIDDSVMECVEVMMCCFEVLTLWFFEDLDIILDYLFYIWVLDKFKIIEEDRKCILMYLEEKKRWEFR